MHKQTLQRATTSVLTSGKEEKTILVLVHTILLQERATSGCTLSITHLKYSESYPFLEDKMSMLWYVLSR